MYNYNNKSEADCNKLKNHYETAIIQAQIKHESYFRKLWLFVIFILVIGSCYLLDKRPESLSINKALLALGITWLALFPSIQYLSDLKRPPIPFLPLVGIFYATGFGLPMFSEPVKFSDRMSLSRVSDQALILVLLGILGMNIAFYVSKYSLWRNVTFIQISESYQRGKLLTLLWVFLLFHIAYYYIYFLQSTPSLNQVLPPLGYISYGIFYILWSRGQLSSIQIWLLCICLPLEFLPRLISGSLATLMILGLFMIIIIWYESKRIPIVLISVTLLFYILLNPVKSEYRSLTWSDGQYSRANPIEKLQLFTDTALKYYSKGGKSQRKTSESEGSALERSTYINLFSDVVENTPTIVPYWGGSTYLNLFTSFIPRALWSDKPVELIGNAFGKRYKYISRFDGITSINLPWIVEMYANFGSSGVLIGMPLVGLLLAFLEQKLNSRGMTPVEVVIGATILFGLTVQESNFSLMVGIIFNLTLFLYLVFRFFLRG